MKNINLISKISLSFLAFASAFAVAAIAIFAVPYANEISAIRQFDISVGIALAVLSIIILAIMIVISIKKKTKGEYAAFGMILASMSIYLYSIIDAERMFKMLYIPAIQNVAVKSGVHMDVTTLQSAQSFANILNILLCAISVILLSAVILSVCRYVSANKTKSLVLTAVITFAVGFIAGGFIAFAVSKILGYADMFIFVAAVTAIFSVSALIIKIKA